MISMMLLALAMAGHSPALTAPFILKPKIPIASNPSAKPDRKPAALEIEAVSADELKLIQADR